MKSRITLILVVLLSLTSCKEKVLEKKAQMIHSNAMTVDSHVDTPMWLTREGFDYGERHDPHASPNKLDLPRMKEGGLDGVFFAVFIGQRERTEEGNLKAKEQAFQIVDSIYSTIDRFSDDLAVALDPDDFRKNTRNGLHTIFLGMENGFPIGLDISLVDTFYNKGVRYITLCHSQNNDICDSSTDSVEHHGISPFGEELVTRMNELGIMVDISHASDQSFYDAIELSKTPIIASHSCSRALCDNPRNLTDDMLLKLRDNGGVIQMCILSDYVKTPLPNPQRDSARQAVRLKHGNYYELDEQGREAFLVDWYKVDEDFPRKLATVSDVVDHIDHMVELIGIDHIGIGTDFDGGGGVEDCYDVSEMGNITLELVRRGYSEEDIKKIWSGNLMRVMQEVKDYAEKNS